MNQPQKPIKVWELNTMEREALRQRALQKWGAKKLLAELQQLRGLEVQAEAAWWEAVILRLRIPVEFRSRLLADSETGRIWVKGEVPDLDAMPSRVSDSPAY